MSAFTTALARFSDGNLRLPELLAVLRDDLERDRGALFEHVSLIESAWRARRIDASAYDALKNVIVRTSTQASPAVDAVDESWPDIRATRQWHRDDFPSSPSVEPTLLRRPTAPSAPVNRGSTPQSGSWPTDGLAWSEGPAAEIESGTVLKERFVLEELIGRGGMGKVYRAKDLRKDEAQDRFPFVAVKVLNEGFRRHPQSLKALQREAKKAQSLAHPNVASVYDFDRDGTTVFMVMELLEGQSLETLIKDRAGRGIPKTEALRIVRSVGAALAYAHEKGMVHADFKPANAFRTHDGSIKVLDFGVARALPRPSHEDGDTTRFDVSELGALTPEYASSEMLVGEEPHPSDDVFALACVTYELLAGRHPFGHVSALLAERRDLKVVPIEGLDRRTWRALAHGLAFSRRNRAASIQEFLDELRPRHRVAASVSIAAAVTLVAGVGAWLYVQGGWPLDQMRKVAATSAEQRAEPVSLDAVATDSEPAPSAQPQIASEPVTSQVIATSAPETPFATIQTESPRPGAMPDPTSNDVETTHATQAEPTQPEPMQPSPPARKFTTQQLKERLLANARMDEVPNALELQKELERVLPPDDDFLVRDAPQAIAGAYARLADRSFVAGNYSSAVALFDRALEIVPEFSLFIERREHVMRAAQLQALVEEGAPDIETLATGLERLRAGDESQFQLVRSRMADALANRIATLERTDGAQAQRLRDVGREVFPGSQAFGSLADSAVVSE